MVSVPMYNVVLTAQVTFPMVRNTIIREHLKLYGHAFELHHCSVLEDIVWDLQVAGVLDEREEGHHRDAVDPMGDVA